MNKPESPVPSLFTSMTVIWFSWTWLTWRTFADGNELVCVSCFPTLPLLRLASRFTTVQLIQILKALLDPVFEDCKMICWFRIRKYLQGKMRRFSLSFPVIFLLRISRPHSFRLSPSCLCRDEPYSTLATSIELIILFCLVYSSALI